MINRRHLIQKVQFK